MVVTYYLAIEKATFLKDIFTSFVYYFAVITSIGIPLLILIGYIHYKKTAAFSSELDIGAEANPYYYKLPPGYWKDVIIPFYLTLSEMMVKISKDKLTEKELEKIDNLQKKMDILIQGGYVGDSKKFKNKID